MNVLEHYVTEIIGEPYYDDYGSGNCIVPEGVVVMVIMGICSYGWY